MATGKALVVPKAQARGRARPTRPDEPGKRRVTTGIEYGRELRGCRLAESTSETPFSQFCERKCILIGRHYTA